MPGRPTDIGGIDPFLIEEDEQRRQSSSSSGVQGWRHQSLRAETATSQREPSPAITGQHLSSNVRKRKLEEEEERSKEEERERRELRRKRADAKLEFARSLRIMQENQRDMQSRMLQMLETRFPPMTTSTAEAVDKQGERDSPSEQ